MVFDNIYADTNAVLKNAPIAQSVLDHIKVKNFNIGTSD